MKTISEKQITSKNGPDVFFFGKILNTFDQKTVHTVQMMKNSFNEELNRFDQVTSKGATPLYRKLSPTLLNMREQERFLIRTLRYAEAFAVRQRADELEAKEIEEYQKNYVNHRNIVRNQMIQANEQKIQCYRENSERIRQTISKSYQQDLMCLQQASVNLNKKIDGIKTSISNDSDNASTYTTNTLTAPSSMFITQAKPKTSMSSKPTRRLTKPTTETINPKWRITPMNPKRKKRTIISSYY